MGAHGTLFVGKVVSNRMQKSVLVAVERFVKMKKYNRILRRTTKLMAHDESNECNIGDTVKIHQSRPISKNKCWRVTEVLHRAKVLDADLLRRAQSEAQTKHAQQLQQPPSFAASAVPQ